MTIPNFLIIGAPRCSTTSLHEWLGQHPDFFMSSNKEPTYFAYGDGEQHEVLPWPSPYPRVWDEYVRQFEGAGERRIVGESSTMYLQVPAAAQRISEHLPGVKMVAVLRDPADRAFSHFALHRSTNSEPIASFREAIDAWPERRRSGWRPNWDYIVPGFYARHLQNFYNAFGADRIKVFQFDEVKANPARVLAEICRFLGAPAGFQFDTSAIHSESGVPRKGAVPGAVYTAMLKLGALRQIIPSAVRSPIARRLRRAVLEKLILTPDDRSYLIELYSEDTAQLEKMLGRDLSAWSLQHSDERRAPTPEQVPGAEDALTTF